MGEFINITPIQMAGIIFTALSILTSLALVVLKRWITAAVEKIDAIPSKEEFERWEAAIGRIPSQTEMDDLKRAIGRIPSEDTKARVFEHFTRMEGLDKRLEAHQVLFSNVSSAIRRLEQDAHEVSRSTADLNVRVTLLEKSDKKHCD